MKQEGVYFDLSDKDYHNDIALGSTGIKHLLDSPLQYWTKSALNPNKSDKVTSALKIGRATHYALFQPEEFSKAFKVQRKYKTSSKPDILGRNEFKIAYKLSKIVRKSVYSKLVENGIAETSVFWKDEKTGIMCKCRFDYLIKANIIVDLKTINNLRRKDVVNELFSIDRRYYLQAAMYVEGLRNLKRLKKVPIGNEQFYFLFITKDDPIEIEVVKIEEDVINLGLEQFREALTIYKKSCDKWGLSNEWRETKPIHKVGLDDAPAWFNYY